jgi:hypothetical protein
MFLKTDFVKEGGRRVSRKIPALSFFWVEDCAAELVAAAGVSSDDGSGSRVSVVVLGCLKTIGAREIDAEDEKEGSRRLA